MRTKKSSIRYVLLLSLFIQPLIAASEMSYARIGTLAGLGLVAGGLAHKFFANKTTIVKKSPAALTEHEMKQLHRAAGKDITKAIAKTITPEFELLAYEDREKLLPSIITIKKDQVEVALKVSREYCAQQYAHYETLTVDQRAQFESNGAIALTAIFFSKSFQNQYNRRDILTEIQKPGGPKYIKNKTNPRVILPRTLGVGEFGLISYSDGDVQIILHDSDRRALNNLSFEQKEFIKGLYHGRGSTEFLTEEQTKIFNSLTPEIKACLSNNYTLILYKKPQKFPLFWYTAKRYAANSFVIATIIAGLIRTGQAYPGINLLRGLGVVASLLVASDGARDDITGNFSYGENNAWLIPIASLLAVETIQFGASLKS